MSESVDDWKNTFYVAHDSVNEDTFKGRLLEVLECRDYSKAANINNPYLKYDLRDAIVRILNDYSCAGETFGRNLYNLINKAEAKRIYYGMVCLDDVSSEIKTICELLTDWEKVCFFAGIWTKRNIDDLYSKTISEIVFDLIKAGYNTLHKRHMIKFAEGEYKRVLKIPESQRYRGRER